MNVNIYSISWAIWGIHLQGLSLLGADAYLGDAVVVGDDQDALRVAALGLHLLPGGEGHHVVPPVPLQNAHHFACGEEEDGAV